MQIDTLLAAGAEEIVYDYQLCNRKKVSLFEKLLDMTESGDTIVVTEICRMCSTALEFVALFEALSLKKLRLVILNAITVDCRSDQYDEATWAYVNLMAMLVDLEHSKLYTMKREGKLGVRKPRGKYGRPKTTIAQIPEDFFLYYILYNDGQMNITEFARACKLSRPTIYKYIKILEDEMQKRAEV